MTNFIPIEMPKAISETESTKVLKNQINNMERQRGWFSRPKTPGVLEELSGRKDQLGPKEANYIEAILKLGGTVAEIGAGKLRACKELAVSFPEGHVIAVEPFVDPDTLRDLPKNMSVIPKSVENLTPTDLVDNSVDAVFSAYVYPYAKDKLGFLTGVWRILKPEAQALIQYFGAPTNPGLPELIKKFKMSDLLNLTVIPSGTLLAMKKVPGRTLDFGQYTMSAYPVGGGALMTEYTFT